jgi:hypothetical protein
MKKQFTLPISVLILTLVLSIISFSFISISKFEASKAKKKAAFPIPTPTISIVTPATTCYPTFLAQGCEFFPGDQGFGEDLEVRWYSNVNDNYIGASLNNEEFTPTNMTGVGGNNINVYAKCATTLITWEGLSSNFLTIYQNTLHTLAPYSELNQPNLQVCPGQTATLYTSSSSVGTTYQWNKKSPTNNDMDPIPGAILNYFPNALGQMQYSMKTTKNGCSFTTQRITPFTIGSSVYCEPINSIVIASNPTIPSMYVTTYSGNQFGGSITSIVPYNNGNFHIDPITGPMAGEAFRETRIILHQGSAPSLVPSIPAGFTLTGDFYNGVSDGTPNGLITIKIFPGNVTSLQNTRRNATNELSFGIQASGPLPINLLSFSGKGTATENLISWTTANAKNFSHFKLYKSNNGKKFEQLAIIPATPNTAEKENYEYFDAPEEAYYKLEMIDLDGSKSDSKIIFVENKPAAESIVGQFFENPSLNNEAKIVIRGTEKSIWKVKQLDLSGRIVANKSIEIVEGLNEISLDLHHKKGVQLFVFEGEKHRIVRKLLAK